MIEKISSHFLHNQRKSEVDWFPAIWKKNDNVERGPAYNWPRSTGGNVKFHRFFCSSRMAGRLLIDELKSTRIISHAANNKCIRMCINGSFSVWIVAHSPIIAGSAENVVSNFSLQAKAMHSILLLFTYRNVQSPWGGTNSRCWKCNWRLSRKNSKIYCARMHNFDLQAEKFARFYFSKNMFSCSKVFPFYSQRISRAVKSTTLFEWREILLIQSKERDDDEALCNSDNESWDGFLRFSQFPKSPDWISVNHNKWTQIVGKKARQVAPQKSFHPAVQVTHTHCVRGVMYEIAKKK